MTHGSVLPVEEDKRDALLARYANQVFRVWRTRSYLLLLGLGMAGMGVAAWRGTTERKIVAKELASEQAGVLSDALGQVAHTRAELDAGLGSLREQVRAADARLSELATNQEHAVAELNLRHDRSLASLAVAARSCCDAAPGALTSVSSDPVDLTGIQRELVAHREALADLGAAQTRKATQLAELKQLIETLLLRLERQEKTGEVSYIVREKSERRLIHPSVTLALGKRHKNEQTLTVRGRDGRDLASRTFDLERPEALVFRIEGYEYEAAPIYLEPRWLLRDRLAIAVRRVPKE